MFFLRRFRGWLLASGCLILLVFALTYSGLMGDLLFRIFIATNQPAGHFDPSAAVSAPQYEELHHWASLPQKVDDADQSPWDDLKAEERESSVDVFFVHPTGLMYQGSWTGRLQVDSATWENTNFMMANQASVFSHCCQVYAPRYRQANIFSYFTDVEGARRTLLEFAYQDVKRAFSHYLAEWNRGRPFILAGHSQGSHHLKRLIEDVVDSDSLHERMIAAYLIGPIIEPVTLPWLQDLVHIDACRDEFDTQCVVAWDTLPLGADPLPRDEPTLCVNPLSWQVDGGWVSESEHLGAVSQTGRFISNIGSKDDLPEGQSYRPLSRPIPQLTSATCKAGSLFVAPDLAPNFSLDPLGTYHQQDYALFYADIVANTKQRIDAYFSSP
jgi:hypothetical protein